MNLTDLRDILDDRSHPARMPAGLERMAGVRARVSAIRQRRAAVIGALAVAGLVIIWYGLVAAHPSGTGTVAARPAASASFGYRLVGGFPEYADGARVEATGTASTHDLVRVSAIAGELGFAFATRCKLPEGVVLKLRWVAKGKIVDEVTCGASFQPAPDMLQTIGARVGDRITFVVSVSEVQQMVPFDGSPGNAPRSGSVPDGTFSVAVMRRLDYRAYPLPPRPTRLAALDTRLTDTVAGTGPTTVIDSKPDPLAPVVATVVVDANARLDMVAQTPGFLRVYVDGTLQARAEWWNYDQGVYAITLRPGEVGTRTLTLQLVPQYMTGAWEAVLRPAQS